MAKEFKTTILINGNAKEALTAIRGVTKELDKLGGSAASSNKRVSAAIDVAARGTRTAALAIVAAGAAAAGALTALTKAGFASIDTLAKTAYNLGVTTEAYASLSYAANLAGVSQTALDSSFKRMARSISDASDGLSTAERSLASLGLSSEELLQLSPEKQFSAIADALNSVDNATRRAALAQQVFGRSGTALLSLTKEGSAGLAAMSEEARILGLNISRVDAAGVERANDAVTRVKTGFAGLGQQLAVQFAPLIEEIANQFYVATENAGGMEEVARGVFDELTNAGALFLDVLDGMEVAWLRVKAATGEALAVAVEATQLASPAGLIRRLVSGPNEFAQALAFNAKTARDEIDTLLARAPASERFLARLRAGSGVSQVKTPTPAKDGGTDTSTAAAEDRAKAIKSLLDNLQQEADTHGKTAEEIALYRLQQLGATETDLKRAKGLAATIARLDAAAEATKNAKKESEAWAKREKEIAGELADVRLELMRLEGDTAGARDAELQQRFGQLLADLKKQGDSAGIEIVNRLINLEAADARLDALKQRLTDATNAFARAQQDAANRVQTGVSSPLVAQSDVREAGGETVGKLTGLREELAALAAEDIPGAKEALAELDAEIIAVTNSSAGGLQKALGDLRTEFAQMRENLAGDTIDALRGGLSQLFVDIADGSKSAKDALADFARGFAQSMLQIAADALATLAVLKLLEAMGVPTGGASGGGVVSKLFHAGGLVGQGGTTRRVPGYIFAGAARYHDGGITGLKPGEVPAILRVGEEVLTANDPRHAANGGGSGQVSIRNIIVDDRGNIGDYMSSADGERVQLDFIERNAMSIKRIIG